MRADKALFAGIVAAAIAAVGCSNEDRLSIASSVDVLAKRGDAPETATVVFWVYVTEGHAKLDENGPGDVYEPVPNTTVLAGANGTMIPLEDKGDGQFEGTFAGYAPHFDFKVNADGDERVFTMPSPSWTTVTMSPDPPSLDQDLLIEWSPNNEEGISVSVTVDGDPVEEPNADPPGVSFADDGTFLLNSSDFASLSATGTIELSRMLVSYSDDFGGDVKVAVSW